MYSRYSFIVIGGVASAAAFVTASISNIFGFEQSFKAAGLHFLAASVITAIAIAVARWLDRPEKAEEADCGHNRDSLPLAPLEPAAPLDEPLDVERLREAVTACSPFVHILHEHLQSTVKDTELAAMTVMTKLKRADNILDGLVRYLHGSAHDKIIPIIEQTQEFLRANNALFGQLLAQRTEAMEESRCRLGCITGLVHSLDGIVHSVREVSRQTNLLALNAKIEAARAGEAGRGFAVVASEVKELSRQSEQAAKDISEGLQTLKSAIDESVDALTVRRAREEKMDLDFITLTIDELGKDLKSLVEHEQDIMVKTQQNSEEISEIVIELMGSMQYQDLVQKSISRATDDIGDVINHAVSLAIFVQAARAGKTLSLVADDSKAASKTVNAIPVDGGGQKLIELF